MSTITEQPTLEEQHKLDPVRRRNFILLMIGMTVYQSSWYMQSVTRAPLINWLGMSNAVYGLIGSAWSLCMIGNFLFPWLSRRYPRKKWYQFVLTMPYLSSDLVLGLAILAAMMAGSHEWLLPLTIGIMIYCPFAAGWTLGPQSEYIANCIPKSHMGRYVSMQQVCVGLVSLAGSVAVTVIMNIIGVPARYAFTCLFAYGIGLAALTVSLFARETPSPSPPPEAFWKPAVYSVRHDRVFRGMLGAGMLLWMAGLLPQNFIPLLAIREWGSPDWIATSAVTIQSGAMILGAALTGLLGQRFTYARAVLVGTIAIPIAMIIGAWPVSSEFRSSSFEQSYKVMSGRVSVESSLSESPKSSNAFRVLGVSASDRNGNELIVQFSSPVDPISFSVNDVIIENAAGGRLQPKEVKAADKGGDMWIIKLDSGRGTESKCRLRIHPYVYSVAGKMLDQDGNGRSPLDAYRVFVMAALWGMAFTGISVGLEALMYQLSPAKRRAGYFSAFRITQFLAPSVAFPLAGAMFKNGSFASTFFALLVFSVLALILSKHLLKPVVLALSTGARQNDDLNTP
ncbi:MAG: MFS transporter [Armatimonadetes bacterium]|nr:MFS transporter [Armatimonadota bacterium]